MNDTSPRYDSYVAEDETTLIDIWRVLARYKRWVIGTPVVFAAAALLGSSLMTPVWEATAAAQVGQVGQIGQIGQGGTLIEPIARVVERMKLKPFGSSVLRKMGKPVEDEEGKLFLDTLKVRAVPNTDLLEVKVRAYTSEMAKAYAEATVALLGAVHGELAKPTIGRLKQQLAKADEQIERTRTELDRLMQAAAKKTPTTSERFMENIVTADVLVKRDKDLRELEQLKGIYEEQLGPLRTYPTSLIDSVYVSDGPVAPRKVLITGLAAVLGLLVGLGIAFVLNTVRRSRLLA
jgi:uncharacterized protein involved in exopolysaccharide biosynthesis